MTVLERIKETYRNERYVRQVGDMDYIAYSICKGRTAAEHEERRKENVC